MSTKPVSARDIVPNLYDDESDHSSGDESEEEIRNKEDIVDDLHYDVHNLLACNYHPVRIVDGQDKEDVLKVTAQRAAQLLLKRLMECPVEPSDVGPLIVLPAETSIIPRGYKLPEEKPETKWEKFAKEKGIKKKKRDRMIFEEETGEYKPRFGYKRANNGIEDVPIIEVKEGADPYADPWSEARDAKKARVDKNAKNQLMNKKKALGKKGIKAPAAYDSVGVPGIPLDIDSKNKKRGKEGLKRALQLAQHSTASMGRYDDMRDGEPMRKIQGKKRSFKDNLGSMESDKNSMKAQLRIVADKADKKARGVTNSLAAYEGILPDAPADRFRQKKGKGKERGSNASFGAGSSKQPSKKPKKDNDRRKSGGKGRK